MELLLDRDLYPEPRLIKQFNGPLDNQYYARMRDYYDADSLQYLFSVGNGFQTFDPRTSIRLINGLQMRQIESRFKMRLLVGSDPFSTLHGQRQVDKAFEAELYAASAPCCFDEYQGQFSRMFWQSVQEKRERTGYILFARQSRRVYFEELSVNSSLDSADDIYKAGDYCHGDRVLANVHTHPGEIYYLKHKVTDAQIYAAQHSTSDSDGRTAISRKTSRYTIGRFNVDFFSPHGQAVSRNNITTVHGLSSGSFNIYKHALEVYGGKRK